jgi:hypothetical protein
LPEILEERFGRAKSGLMLAPANTQANAQVLTTTFPQVINSLKMLPRQAEDSAAVRQVEGGRIPLSIK